MKTHVILVLIVHLALVLTVSALQTPPTRPTREAPQAGRSDPQAEQWTQDLRKLMAEGKYEEAAKTAQALLNLLERTLGTNHPDTVSIRVELEGMSKAVSLSREARQELAQTRSTLQQAVQKLQEDPRACRRAADEAIRSVERHFGAEHQYLIEALSAAAGAAQADNDLDNALKYGQRAADLCKRYFGEKHPLYGSALHSLAGIHMARQQYIEAIAEARESMAIATAVYGDNNPATYIPTSQLVDAYRSVGQFEQAITLLEKMLTVQERTAGPKHPLVSAGRLNLGQTYAAIGNYDRAEAEIRTALKVYDEIPRATPEQVRAWTSLSEVYLSMGRYQEAAHGFTRAYQKLRQLNMEAAPDAVPALAGMVHAYESMGAFDEAEPAAQRLLLSLRNLHGADDPVSITALGEMAAILQRQGRWEEATVIHRRRLQMASSKLGLRHPFTLEAHESLADTLKYTSIEAGALESFLREMLITRQSWAGPDHPATADALSRLAVFELQHGKLVNAREDLERVGKLREQFIGPDDPAVAMTFLNLAHLTDLEGHRDQALAHAQRALAMMKNKLPAADKRTLAAGVMVARLAHLSGNRVLAEAALAEMLDAARTLSFDASAPSVPSWEIPDQEVYRTAAAILMDLGRSDDALSALDRHWQEQWMETLGKGGINAATVLLPPDREQERKLTNAINARHQQIEMLKTYGLPAQDAEQAGAHLSVRWKELVRGLMSNERFVAWATPQPVNLEKVGVALGDDKTAVIGWLDRPSLGYGDSNQRRFGFVLRKGRPTVWERLPDASSDDASPPRAADAAKPAVEADDDLFMSRIAPLMPHLEGVSHVIVIATSTPMTQIPVESLKPRHGGELLDKFTFSYASSLTALIEPPLKPWGSPESSPLGVLAVGGARQNPDGHRRFGSGTVRDFQKSDAEARAVANMLPESTMKLGDDGSGPSLFKMAKQGLVSRFSYLHLGNYAYADPVEPHRSALMLALPESADPFDRLIAGDHFSNGWVDVREVLNMRLRAKVVSLPGCNTLWPDRPAAEDALVLARAFQLAGAESVMMSLWNVEEDARMLLVTKLYENIIQRKQSPALALQRAKLWLRQLTWREAVEALRATGYGDPPPDAARRDPNAKPYDHPHFWAAFVLVL